jgi:hypothetical protein
MGARELGKATGRGNLGHLSCGGEMSVGRLPYKGLLHSAEAQHFQQSVPGRV